MNQGGTVVEQEQPLFSSDQSPDQLMSQKLYREGFAESVYDHDFGVHLRCTREARGWTREELATKSGVSVRTIGRLEDELFNSPQRETLLKLANALDVVVTIRLTTHRAILDEGPLTNEKATVAAYTPDVQGQAALEFDTTTESFDPEKDTTRKKSKFIPWLLDVLFGRAKT